MEARDTLLSCACGKEIKSQDFKKHYIECNLLAEDLGEVSRAVNNYIKENRNIQKWRNLVAYFDWASGCYMKNLMSKRPKLEKQVCVHCQVEIKDESVKLLGCGHLIHKKCLKDKYISDNK